MSTTDTDTKAAAGISIDFRKIYFNAVLGGIGGLLGWLLMASMESGSWDNVYVWYAVIGPLIGICIGMCIGSSDGIIVSRSLSRLAWGALVGALLGALGGLIGLPLGEFIFQTTRDITDSESGVWPKALGWAVFGLFVGMSDGFAWMLPNRIRYGMVGGLLGGLVGGSVYQSLSPSSSSAEVARWAWGSGLGLIILGACIGALVGLVESLLRKSWLFFVTGRLEGQTITLDSSRTNTIGTTASCTIIIPGDPKVMPVHAELTCINGNFVVAARDGEVMVIRDGLERTVASCILEPMDRIRIGDTRMSFRTVEVKS